MSRSDDDLDPVTIAHSRVLTATRDFADACVGFSAGKPDQAPLALEQVMVSLMTELWDHGFTQSQIKTAFEAALADMPRYTRGFETRPF